MKGNTMNKYNGNDNNGNPKSNYINKLSNLDESRLQEKTEKLIWLSAYASNNPKSDYHWQCDACYDEWVKRDGNDNNYSKCFKNVTHNN